MSDGIRIAYLTSDRLRKRFLRKMCLYLDSESFNETLFKEADVKALRHFLSAFPDNERQIRELRARNKSTKKDYTKAVIKLEKAVRDAWIFSKKAIFYSEKHVPDQLFVLYGASHDSAGSRTGDEWLMAAEDLIIREPKAITEGLPPLTAPTSAQLRTLLEPAQRLYEDLCAGRFEVMNQRSRLETMREEVDLLYADLYSDIRYKYRGQNQSTIRQTCRGMGFVFYSKKNKKEDEEQPAEKNHLNKR